MEDTKKLTVGNDFVPKRNSWTTKYILLRIDRTYEVTELTEVGNSKRQRITLYILIKDTKTLKFRILKV